MIQPMSELHFFRSAFVLIFGLRLLHSHFRCDLGCFNRAISALVWRQSFGTGQTTLSGEFGAYSFNEFFLHVQIIHRASTVHKN
jgi:hypothetical protein